MQIRGRKLIGAGLALSLLFGVSAGTAAGAASGQDDAVMSPAARGVAQVLTAAELAVWGRERGDAGALIMAARLLAEVPVRRTQTEADAETPFLTPTGLLDEAAALADGNTGLIDAIDRLRDPLTRGVRSSPFGAGPVLTVKSLQARENWAFDVEARGGEILRIAAIGDGDTNIDLTVRDANGTVVCRDGYGDHYPVCTLSPRAAGQLQVDIVNRGNVWTKVQVLSN